MKNKELIDLLSKWDADLPITFADYNDDSNDDGATPLKQPTGVETLVCNNGEAVLCIYKGFTNEPAA